MKATQRQKDCLYHKATLMTSILIWCQYGKFVNIWNLDMSISKQT